MEKEKKKIIIIGSIAILIFIVALIGGIYFFSNSYDGTPVEKEEELTESTINRYLDYIPFAIYDTDTVPYYNKSITVSEVAKNLLINTALNGTDTFIE